MSLLVVEELLSSDGRHKARIVQRAVDGLFSVELERLVPGDGPYEPPAYWSPVRRSVIIADSIERARDLARETLESSRG